MEEDNQEISGWNDQNLQILDDRCFKFTKKKINQPTPLEQTKMSRRLIASRTLPVIKNMRSSLIKQSNTDCKQKDIETDGIISSVGKKLTYPQRVTQIEENKRQKNHHIRHNKRGHYHHQTLVMDIQHYLIGEDNDSFKKHQSMSKHQLTTSPKQEELSNISKLKIQVSQYSSNPKRLSFQYNGRSDKSQVKLDKNYEKEFIDKKYNSKYFEIKKRIDSNDKGQQQQGSSKKKIQTSQSFDEEGNQSLVKQSKPNAVLKQQYKNIANTIQFRKKNQYRIFNPKYNGLSKLANQKKKKPKIDSSCQQKQRINNNLSANFNRQRGCWLSTNSQTFLKSRKEKQNQFHSIKLNNQRSLKTMPQTNQVKHQNLIDEFNQQLGLIFVRKQKTHVAIDNLIIMSTDTPIKNMKDNSKISKISSRKERMKISSQPTVLDEFSDEYIFVHKQKAR